MACSPRLSLLAGAAMVMPVASVRAAPPPTSTQVQAATPDTDSTEDEDIVITGKPPRGSVVGDIPPDNVMSSRDVRSTGATNFDELLESIAPQLGSLRDPGADRPLVLLNGRRVSSYRELRDIPIEAIQRVDILPEEVALK
jgi:hypothetical protein